MKSNRLLDLYSLKKEYKPLFKDILGRPKFFNNTDHSLFDPLISKNLVNNGWAPEYPESKDFAICLSHDIDKIFNFKKSRFESLKDKIIYTLKLEKKLKRKQKFIKHRISEIDPGIFLEMNREYGIVTTFFILCLQEGDQDFTYTFDDMAEFSAKIGKNELQLHGGHKAYNNPGRLVQEKAYFEKFYQKKSAGYRNHYLRFTVPDTWLNLENEGYSWDSTVGYAEMPGFRNGMCHPYHPLVNGDFLNILEIPVIAMDTSLFEYNKLGLDDAYRLLIQLIDTVKQYKGAVSILWHNHYLEPPYDILYKNIITYIKENNGWMPTCSELANHWIQKGYGKYVNQKIMEFE